MPGLYDWTCIRIERRDAGTPTIFVYFSAAGRIGVAIATRQLYQFADQENDCTAHVETFPKQN